MTANRPDIPDSYEVFEPDSSHGQHYRYREVSGDRDRRDQRDQRKRRDHRERGRAWVVSRLRFLGPLPPQPGEVPSDAERAVLLAAYEQVGATWRGLTEVRFKLLALIPVVSVIALSQVLKDDDTSPLPTPAKLLIIAIGAAMSGGLWIYDTRNNELYDELISRGRRIEAELGVHTGAYLGRPASWHSVISHRSALGIVYGVTLIGWLAAIPVVLT
jgi:hypothetical protein